MNWVLASMKDADPVTGELWPTLTAKNLWKGKNSDDLLRFFNEWYYLLPEPGNVKDEFNYKDYI